MRNVALTIFGSWILIQYGHPMVEQHFLHTIIYIRARSQVAEKRAGKSRKMCSDYDSTLQEKENEVKSQRNAREEAKEALTEVKKERDTARLNLSAARETDLQIGKDSRDTWKQAFETLNFVSNSAIIPTSRFLSEVRSIST